MALDIIGKARKVILSPDSFFSDVKNEGLQQSVIYQAIVLLLGGVLTYLLTPAATYSAMLALYGLPITLGIASILVIWIIGMVLSFAISVFIHVFVMIFGGKQGFVNTYKAFAYSYTPAILSSIPFAGFVFVLWSLYLSVKGISILHNMSIIRAIVAIAIPLLIIAVIFVIFFLWPMMTLTGPK